MFVTVSFASAAADVADETAFKELPKRMRRIA
jgi:hypothetical protein